MQDRLVIAVTAILAAAIGLAAIAIPLLRTDGPYAVLPFDVVVRAPPQPAVGANLSFYVDVQAHTGWPYPVGTAFLSLDVGTDFRILSEAGSGNAWRMPNVWNVSGMDFGPRRTYALNVTALTAMDVRLQAMLWSPRGDVGSVQIDANGQVNPASVSILGLGTLCFTVANVTQASSGSTTLGTACSGPAGPA